MPRFLLPGFWLAGLVLGQAALANPLLPAFSPFHPLIDSVPVITCPPNQTIQLVTGQCERVVQYQVTATDDQPGVIVVRSAGLASGSSFPIGIVVNSFVALDAGGNTATCSFTVTVLDPPTVTLSCPPLFVAQLDANCSRTLSSAEILNPNTCPSANFIVEIDRIPPFGNGPWQPGVVTNSDLNKTYQVRVSTFSGNRCWGNMQIKDTLPPSVVCPDLSIPCVVSRFTPDYLVDTLDIAAGKPTYLDNCGGTPTSNYTDVTSILPCNTASTTSSIILRTWTFKDISNNQRTCLQKITLRRSLADVQFPPDVTLACGHPDLSVATNGVPFIAVGAVHFPIYPLPTCGITAFLVDTLVPECEGTNQLRRTWKVYDFCPALSAANPKIHVQNLNIQDVVAPAIACPTAVVRRANAVGCTGKIKLPDAVITDGCAGIANFAAEWTTGGGGQAVGHLSNWPGNDPMIRDTLGSLDSLNFPTGTTLMQYKATDVCGNTSTCSFTLFVTDTVPPTAICRPFLEVQLTADGTFMLRADSLDAGSSDACTPVFFKVNRPLPNPCQANDQFYDAAVVCCADIGDTITLQLRVYDAPLLTNAVALNFDSAYSKDCTVRVNVTDQSPLQCTAPLDVMVTCDSFDATLATYGSLLARSCQADSLEILVDYSQFDTACRHGQIIRTFRVHDTAGHSADCMQHITSQNFQDYYVRFPDDVIVTACDLLQRYGEPQINALRCEKMQVAYDDQIYTVVEDACYKIERTWRIINLCQYDTNQPLTMVPNPNPTILTSPGNVLGPVVSPIGTPGAWAPTLIRVLPTDPTLTNYSSFWSDTTNGYQYTQIIKVIDGVAPIAENCPTTALIFADSTTNNPDLWHEPYYYDPATSSSDLTEAPVLVSSTALDSCSGSDLNYRYLLFLDLNNDGTQETVINSNNFTLPVGQQVTPGTLQYNNALNPNFTGGTNYTFDGRPLNAGQKYRFAIETAVADHRKTAWVRWNTALSPTLYRSPQLPPGKHKIKWFVGDGCGNETVCQYNFTINRPVVSGPFTISGTISTELNVGIENVQVGITQTPPGVAPLSFERTTDSVGHYIFPAVPNGTDYALMPMKNAEPLNGVTTYDLVLISQHILDINTLNSPYKIIAADANKSNSVTATDILELRKMVLGIYENGLPNAPSWRFVNESFVFPNPNNPFQTPFPETHTEDSLTTNQINDFVGIKIGDVNNSASSNLNGSAEDRTTGTWWMETTDREVQPGETINVTFRATEAVAGYQFTLDYPGLAVINIKPGSMMQADNFAVFSAESAFTTSFNPTKPADKPEFTVQFRAHETGRLSQILHVSGRITAAQAYSIENIAPPMDVQLRFGSNSAASAAFELLPCTPNPFAEQTKIGFRLPMATTATLRIFDMDGRTVYAHTADYSAGLHSLAMHKSDLKGSGVFFYQLQTPTDSAVRKMVVVH